MMGVAGLSMDYPAVADAAELSAMAQASFCDTFAYRNYPADDLTGFLASAMGPDRYAAQIADPDYALQVVRNSSNEIIGFIKMGPNDLPLVDSDRNDTVRELHQLYLLPAAKGTGMAQKLMFWGLDWALRQGAKAVYLSVYCENFRAQKFYGKHGFVEVGKNPFMVGNTCDDDRVWRKSL